MGLQQGPCYWKGISRETTETLTVLWTRPTHSLTRWTVLPSHFVMTSRCQKKLPFLCASMFVAPNAPLAPSSPATNSLRTAASGRVLHATPKRRTASFISIFKCACHEVNVHQKWRRLSFSQQSTLAQLSTSIKCLETINHSR